MNPWIQNISYSDVKNGFHIDPGINAMMINIVDPGMEFPVPKYQFREIHRFEFLDLEKNDNWGEEFKITYEQAVELVRLLRHALVNRMNVIVSCVAGVCRSGAVCEVGVLMGFRDTEDYRSPNLMVKHFMMDLLNMEYNPDEPHTVNGRAFEYDELNNKVWLDEKKENDD
jgi:protein tyrosine phosphatase